MEEDEALPEQVVIVARAGWWPQGSPAALTATRQRSWLTGPTGMDVRELAEALHAGYHRRNDRGRYVVRAG